MSAGRQFVRSLSTSSAVSNLVKTPVSVFGIEGRYATALYSAASKNKCLDAVDKDLKTFHAQFKKDARLQEFLLDPSVGKKTKAEGLASVCDKLKLNALSKNMFMAISDNGRYKFINNIVNSFETIMSAHRGEVKCEITTAKPLQGDMKKEVDSIVASFMKSGQKPLIDYIVDPNIVGGMIVSVGDKYVDMSMSSKLKKYEEIIKSAA